MAEILHVVPKFVGLFAEEYQASFWLSVDPNPGPADVSEVAANITDWLQDMYDIYAPAVRNTITAIEYAVYIYDLLAGEESFYFTGGWTFTGTAAGDSTSPLVAPTISAGVLLRDRPGQKRMIPTMEAQVANGTANASLVSILGNFATQWVTVRPPSATFTYTPGILSKSPLPVTFAPFDGTTFVREVLGTARSRKPGIGI